MQALLFSYLRWEKMELSKRQQMQSMQILEKLYADGATSRIELAKTLHITPATVSDITAVLINDGVIEEVGIDTNDTNVGRRKILLDVLGNYRYYVGVELTQEYIAIALTDNIGTKIANKQFLNNNKLLLTPENLVIQIQSFLSNYTQYPIAALGLAVPGYYDNQSKTIQTDNPYWNNFDIGFVMDAFPFDVYCKNKVHALSYHLRYFNKDDVNKDNFSLFHIRSGMSCTFMYNGNIYGEFNPNVGEIGHVSVNPDGPLCSCGNRGCLQTYIGQPALLEKAQLLYRSGNATLNSLVGDERDISLETVLLAYELGDLSITSTINQALEALAGVIHNSGMVIDAYQIYMHGNIFENKHIQQVFQEKMARFNEIFSFTRKKNYHILNFDLYDSALGGCALALYRDLLQK